MLNLTSTQADTDSFITVWPTGTPRPNASNLNTDPGQDTPNLVIATVGTNGKISLYNDNGTGHLVADLLGWYPQATDFVPRAPVRLLDTRNGTGAPAGPLGPRSSIDLQITGTADLPTTGVAAVVLNLTSTQADTDSFITVWPTGTPRPNASNLNTDPGQDTPNLVIATVGTNGKISLYNDNGTGHLVADLLGWYPQATDHTDFEPPPPPTVPP